MKRAPHEVLGVASDASPAEVRAAWQRAAFRLHPDRCHDADAAARLQEAREAFEAMTRPENETDVVEASPANILEHLFRRVRGRAPTEREQNGLKLLEVARRLAK